MGGLMGAAAMMQQKLTETPPQGEVVPGPSQRLTD